MNLRCRLGRHDREIVADTGAGPVATALKLTRFRIARCRRCGQHWISAAAVGS